MFLASAAAPYLGLILHSSQKYGIKPEILAGLLSQESGFQPDVITGQRKSSAGAVGVAQFMPTTWSGSWNPYRGQSPTNPQAAIPAAALYLSRLTKMYGGNYTKALAAYNAGPGNVDHWQSIPQTAAYVPAVFEKSKMFPGLAGAEKVPQNHQVPQTTEPPLQQTQAPVVQPQQQVQQQQTPQHYQMNPQQPANLQPGGDPLQQSRTALLGYLMSQNQAYASGQQGQNNIVPILAQMMQSNQAPQGLMQFPQSSSPQVQQGTPPSMPAEAPVTAPKAQRTIPNANPLAPYKGSVLGAQFKLNGLPGQGTHSFTSGPNNWESDNAVDLSVKYGTPVYAAQDGVIGSQIGSLNSQDPKMAGLRLHLKTNDNEWYYAHLSKIAPGIKPGMKVKKGALIGFSGAANGVNHLHLGVEHGNPVNLLNLGG
jgi:murein DD-endopeptidase MepM/ murein hydrolase activator NlpD